MFQNIHNDTYEQLNEDVELKNSKIEIIKKLFNKQNILLYIISFMISTVGFGDGINPFAIAILAAVCSNNIPIGIIYILTLIGTGIGFGKESLLIYFLTSLIFFVSMAIFKVRIDEINNNKKLGFQICLATAACQFIKMIFSKILIYDILVTITFTIAVYIFYKIFTKAVYTINNINEKKVFAVEELLALSLLIAISVAGFKDITIFQYSLKNILSILIVLILGWKKGVLVGATSGITIGLVLGIIGGGEISQVASYAISGMIAGLLNNFGKIGVIIGFVLGNACLTYIANGDTNSIIRFQEILIASIGLLAMPKKFKINLEDIFEKNKYLPVVGENRLEKSENAIFKLNNVSEVISEVAKSYKQVAATTAEKEIEEDEHLNVFWNELLNNIEKYEDNILYDYLTESEDIVKEIYELMISQEYLTKSDILKILENNNNYIIETDNNETNKKINDDINNIIREIYTAYRVCNLNEIYNKKMQKSKESMGNQLEGISKTINSIIDNLNEENKNENINEEDELKKIFAKKEIEIKQIKINKKQDNKTTIDIYTGICNSEKIEECKCEKIEKILNTYFNEKVKLVNETCNKLNDNEICKLKYTSEDKYNMQIGIAKTTKYGSIITGDSNLNVKLEDGKRLVAISDGMGSGPKAKQSSNIAIKLLKRLLLSGFDKETSIELINSSLCLNSKDETYATLDMAVIDLYKGNVEFVKNGACPTYIKNKKNVDIIKTISIPTGILENIDLDVFDRDIADGDILVMCSDGILESNSEYENKELWLKYLLENIETQNAQKIADLILQEAIDNCVGKAKDDMTVMVVKLEVRD